MSAILLASILVAAPWDAQPTVPVQWIGESEQRRVRDPKRIITLAPSVTEFAFAVGAGDRVIGRSRYCDFPAAASKLPAVGGFLDPNIEAIVAAKPDLVIAVPNSTNRPALERMAKLGVVVLVVPGNSFADTFHAGRAVADALGGVAPAHMEKILGSIKADVVAVERQMSKRPTARVVFVYDHNPLVVAGPGSFADTMLRMLNAENVVRVKRPYPTYSMEQLIIDAPAVILDAAAEHVGAAKREDWNKYKKVIPAIRDGRLHTFDVTSTMRAGPRIGRALRMIADLLLKTNKG